MKLLRNASTDSKRQEGNENCCKKNDSSEFMDGVKELLLAVMEVEHGCIHPIQRRKDSVQFDFNSLVDFLLIF